MLILILQTTITYSTHVLFIVLSQTHLSYVILLILLMFYLCFTHEFFGVSASGRKRGGTMSPPLPPSTPGRRAGQGGDARAPSLLQYGDVTASIPCPPGGGHDECRRSVQHGLAGPAPPHCTSAGTIVAIWFGDPARHRAARQTTLSHG